MEKSKKNIRKFSKDSLFYITMFLIVLCFIVGYQKYSQDKMLVTINWDVFLERDKDDIYTHFISWGFTNVQVETVCDLVGEDAKKLDNKVLEVSFRGQLITRNSKIKRFSGLLEKDTEIILYAHKKQTNLCSVKGCAEIKTGAYCIDHTCTVERCTNEKTPAALYCDEHGCYFCDNKKPAITGSNWCYKHTCSKNGCYANIREGVYCSKHQDTANQSTSSKNNSSSSYISKYRSKKKIVNMPDPDDYDSYEDFMDDWDGNMPDGSDAEDYWEDW